MPNSMRWPFPASNWLGQRWRTAAQKSNEPYTRTFTRLPRDAAPGNPGHRSPRRCDDRPNMPAMGTRECQYRPGPFVIMVTASPRIADLTPGAPDALPPPDLHE